MIDGDQRRPAVAGPTRRTLLAAGGAAVLAACSTTDPGARPGTPSATPSSGRPPSSSGPARPRSGDWARLARSIDGSLARPGTAAYGRTRLTENPRYDGARPLAVLSVASTADVVAGLAFARDHDLPLAVRSGGHSYPGWSAGDGRLVLDVRPLSQVVVAGDRAAVGAGASLAQVYDALGSRGRGIAGGSCPTVGVAGLTQGGGVGVLTRAYGLTCDAVRSMTVVTAEGRTVTASADEESDLFWALRGGGGGHVGVVTAFGFDTFAAPDVSTTFLQWPLAAVTEVLPAWFERVPTADPRLWSTLKGLAGTRHPDGPVVDATVTWVGSAATYDAQLDRLLADLPAPAVRSTQRRPYLAVMQAYAGCTDLTVGQCSTTAPTGRLQRQAFAATSHVAYAAPEAAGVSAFADRVEAGQDSGLPETGLSVDALGGRVADVDPGATAFVHRRALATVQYTATYDDGGPSAAVRYVEGARTAMTPSWGGHAYVNYADVAIGDYRSAYFGANADRLAGVRRTYDPDDVFTQPQPW